LIHILSSLPQPIQTLLMALVTAMRKVEPRDIHPRFNEHFELLHRPASRAQSANDFGTTGTAGVGSFHHVEVDVAAGQERDVGCVGDHDCLGLKKSKVNVNGEGNGNGSLERLCRFCGVDFDWMIVDDCESLTDGPMHLRLDWMDDD
jgi:hypothetical protein